MTRLLAALTNAACYLPARLVAAWDAADARLASALDPTWEDDPWPDVTAKVNEVNARPKPEPIEGPPF